MTSQPTQPNHIQQTLFAEDFPVKISAQQGEVKALQKKPDQVYFTNSSESYAWYDQNTSSWKTWQRSLLTDWTSFSENFPKQGTMQNGQLYQQVHWELATKEADGGSLPTPTREAAHHRNNVPPSIGVTRGYDLTMKICEEQNKLLPTPLASDPDRKAKFKQGGTPLRGAILPTPRAAIGMGMKLSKGMAKLQHKKYLETEIAAKLHTNGEVQNTDLTQTGDNMYLNPQFVEEMMGYPLNWTLNKEFKD